MTDLLTSLVDRALDRAPVLQRRQPTLFEPTTEPAISKRSDFSSPSLLHEEETVAEPETSPRPQRSAFLTNTSHSLRQSPMSEEPPRVRDDSLPTRRRDNKSDPAPENDRETTRRESVAAALVSESPGSATGREERPSAALMTHVVARQEETSNAPQRLIETIVERRVDREVISEHSKDTPIKDQQALTSRFKGPREASRDVDAAQAKRPLPAEAKPLSSPKVETITKPSIQKKPAPRRENAPFVRPASRSESTRALKQPTPSTINVTIGRVEVRAISPATGRAQTPRPAGPRLSLEDYLRSRGEGN